MEEDIETITQRNNESLRKLMIMLSNIESISSNSLDKCMEQTNKIDKLNSDILNLKNTIKNRLKTICENRDFHHSTMNPYTCENQENGKNSYVSEFISKTDFNTQKSELIPKSQIKKNSQEEALNSIKSTINRLEDLGNRLGIEINTNNDQLDILNKDIIDTNLLLHNRLRK